MADWAHGYDVSVGYTYGYFREMAPDWLDLCVRLNGFIPPRRGPDGRFRYLDLGTGQGFGLCLLAAANPQGEFLGIDFLPEHIAHAEALAEMAGLTNVRFIEADFNDLAAIWPKDFGTFDYVVMHGIYSWIPDQVRRSVIACLAHSTRPGALVYNSFNTPPGWQGLTAFQHVTRRLKETTGKTGKAVLDESFGLFDKLIENNASLFKAMPNLKSRIDAVKKQKSAYAIQEYLNESWHLLWHSQVAGDMAQVKLDHVGTATIAEVLLPTILPAPMRDLLTEQGDHGLSEDLQDIAINQSFRRDIYCRGARRALGKDERRTTMLHLLAAPAPGALEVRTTFGTYKVDEDDIGEIVAALGSGPQTVGDIAALPSMRTKGWWTSLRAIALLLQARAIGVGAADPGNGAASHRINATIAGIGPRGAPYRYIAAPQLGSAVPATDFELMLIDCWLSSGKTRDRAALVKVVKERIVQINPALKGGNEVGQRSDDGVRTFFETSLPRWQRLGALPLGS